MLQDELKARMRVLRRLGYLDNGESAVLYIPAGWLYTPMPFTSYALHVAGWREGCQALAVACVPLPQAGVSVAPCLVICRSFIAADGLVTAKGRLAAELTSGHDELVLAELLMGGAFADLATDQLVALCSCFVWSEKSDGSHKSVCMTLFRHA